MQTMEQVNRKQKFITVCLEATRGQIAEIYF